MVQEYQHLHLSEHHLEVFLRHSLERHCFFWHGPRNCMEIMRQKKSRRREIISEEQQHRRNKYSVQHTIRPRDLSLASALGKVMLFFHKSLCVSLLKKLISASEIPDKSLWVPKNLHDKPY